MIKVRNVSSPHRRKLTGQMERVASFSPTPSSSSYHQQPIYFGPPVVFAQIDPSMRRNHTPNQTMMTPHGQMVLPMSSAHPPLDCGPSPYYTDEHGVTPHHPHMYNGPNMQHTVMVSPTDHLDARHYQQPHQMHHPNPSLLHRNNGLSGNFDKRPPSQGAMGGGHRPMLARGQTMHVPPRPTQLHRQASLHNTTARSASPHMAAAGDLFDPLPGSPIKRPSTVAAEVQQHHHHFEPTQEQLVSCRCVVPLTHIQFYHPHLGISPARAMGPPPPQPPRFSPQHTDLMITPYGQKTVNYEQPVPSSAASSSSLSSQQESQPADLSDEENDSPTKGVTATRAMSKMQINEKAGPSRNRPTSIVIRAPRPAKPTSGGRTSAKFAKVAEDPGVEGIPPGPRPLDRPGPSFACIIGQAILRCKAGGLSLEHIYRYVETAYPFFKNDNPAWRNSVRHNLSIHKMFETIPRTEMFPPGKGGIWIIHEDEKCHWPEDNKFIKNFPSNHPHYATCRQTLHDKAKEQAQIEKAAKEGKVYVPKKGKKGRKLPGGEDAVDMGRTDSAEMDYQAQTPPMMGPPDLPQVEDEDGEFLPMEDIQVEPMVENVPMFPRYERKEKRRIVEEDNVFVATKRVRVAEPMPLQPLLAHPQESVLLDDTFITPERERPLNNAKIMSSAFKTPALVNTSSSPGSSPMPPTVTRTAHHPSALQQAWTHADMADIVDSSPQRPMLDAAFDFQPAKLAKNRSRPFDDEYPLALTNPPKTPLTRSSAAREIKTPAAMLSKTPLTFGRSPAQVPPTVTALLSTPMWEMGGCLDRLKDAGSSPTQSIRSPMRSPVPPTSPTRYAMLLGSAGSPSSKRLRDFSL